MTCIHVCMLVYMYKKLAIYSVLSHMTQSWFCVVLCSYAKTHSIFASLALPHFLNDTTQHSALVASYCKSVYVVTYITRCTMQYIHTMQPHYDMLAQNYSNYGIFTQAISCKIHTWRVTLIAPLKCANVPACL